MKQELKHKEIDFTIETTQQQNQTWKCEARVFLTADGIDVPSLEGFDTEQEAEADTTDEAKRLIDYSLGKRGIANRA
jgi:hypothetical protein